MPDFNALLATLKARGIHWEVVGLDQAVGQDLALKIQAPRGAMDAELQAQIKAYKSELIAEGRPRTPQRARAFQERLWLLQQLEPHAARYHEATYLHWQGKAPDLQVLTRAFQQIHNRHDALRTGFVRQEGHLYRVWNRPSAHLCSLSLNPDPVAFIRQPFDLAAGSLFRMAWYPDTQRLLLVFHHLIADAASAPLLLQDLKRVLAGETVLPCVSPEPVEPEPVELEPMAADTAAPTVDTPPRVFVDDLPRLAHRGSTVPDGAERTVYELPVAVKQRLMQGSARAGVTAFNSLLSAWQCFLQQYWQLKTPYVATPITQRHRYGAFQPVDSLMHTFLLSPPTEATFADVLQRQQQELYGAFETFDLSAALRGLQLPAELPFFPLLGVVIQPQFAPQPLNDENTLCPLPLPWLPAKFALLLTWHQGPEGHPDTLELAWPEGWYDTEVLQQVLAHFVYVWEQLLLDPQQALATLPLMPPEALEHYARAQQPLGLPAAVKAFTTVPARLHHCVERVAAQRPEALALQGPHAASLSYGELNARANQRARRLQETGVKPGDGVLVEMAVTPELLITLLAVLKAGAYYIPLQPDTPPRRRSHILSQAQPVCILDDAWAADRSGEAQASDLNVDLPLAEDALAYQIFTSGSTGLPKPVPITHGQICRLFPALTPHMDFAAHEVWLLFHSIAFDFSVWEVWGAFYSGAVLTLMPAEQAYQPQAVWALIQRYGVTQLSQTPSAFQAMSQALPAALTPETLSLKRVILSGEKLTLGQLKPWWQRMGDAVELVNAYGITETTVFVTWHVLGSAERRAAQTPGALWPGHDSPIGQPLCDLGIELYDAAGRPVPDGVPGEIRVVGAGVSTPYGPVYASGDWALRWQGQYYYLQRRDRQVQVRGVRVECGEVEAALVQLPEISQAYVCAWEQGLAAVVAAEVSAETAADALWQQESRWKQALRQYVTAAMVPDRIWVWPAAASGQNFPVTANGKQDTEALNAFLARQRVADAHSGPASPVASAVSSASTASAEGHLARILPVFQRVLQRQDIPLNASFFDLGAHSLRLLELQHELETVVGFALDPVILFRYPTLGQFLAYLDALDTLEDETEAITALTPLAVDSTQAEIAPNAPIAVIGMGLRLPGADSPESYWSLLQSGRSGLSTWTPEDLRAAGESPERLADPFYVPVSGWIPDADVFDAAHFGLSAREALWMDPQQRLMLTLAHETLEQAGYTDRQRPQAVGVFASAGISRYLLETLLPTVQQSPSVDRSPMQLLIANDKDYLPTRIAHSLNLTGPALAVQSACSSSLAAVHLACQSLRQGECSLALAGGVNLDSRPRGYVYQEGGIYAKDGVCRPFDASATGIVGGSGGGWVLLKPLAAAQADGDRIYAVIEGSMITNDGADKVGYLAPGVAGQVRAVAGALQRAGRRPEDIGYIEAHGTGTRLGDPIEVAALKQVWQAAGTSDTAGTARTARTALGSVKANIGHLDAAAGIASLIKVVLMLHHQQWVPTPHVQQLNPALGLDEHSPFFVNTQTQPWQGAPGAGVSSLGVGGTNVHVVCAPAPASFSTASVSPSPAVSAAEPVLLPLVLPDASALERAFPRWLAALPEVPSSEVSLADWAHTLWQRQQRWPRGLRLPVVARNTTEAREAWQQLAQRSQPVSTEARSAAVQPEAAPLPVVFVCPGLGSQSLESLQRFYAQSPVFAQHFDTCVALLRTLAAEDARIAVDLGQWRQWQPEDLLAPQAMQISIFVMGWCLAQAWQALGVYPQYIVGHSFGECLAVTLAGQISLREALRWVALRGYAFAQWQAQLPEPYGVLAVGAAPESLELAAWPTLALATQNLDNRCTLSGPLRDLQAFAKTFTQTHAGQGHVGLTRLLPIPHGVHTAALHTGGLSEGLRAATAHLPDAPLWEASSAAGFQCPWVWSAVQRGPWPASLEAKSPSWRDSWLTQTQQFLDFRPAVAAIRALPQAVILELSGEPQLTSLFTGDGRRGLLQKTPQSWLELVAKAWGLGAPVQLAQVLPAQGKPALLPPTPLAQTVYCLPTPGAGSPSTTRPEVRPEAPPETVPLQYTAWRPVPALTLRRWQQRPALAVQDVDVRQPFEATSITAPVLRVQVPDLHTLAEALDYVEACRQWVLALGSLQPPQTVSTWLWQVPAFSGGEGTESMNLQPFQSLVQALLQTLSQTVNQNLAQASAGVSVCLCEHEAGVAPEALPPVDGKMPFQHLRWAQQRWWQPTTEALSAADLQAVSQGVSQAPSSLATPLREGGVYLITGASGGMATVLRQYLQQQYRARVVCLSRQPAPEDLPLEVLWLQGDVTQAQDVEHALELAYAQFGGLHGILHTAGQSHEAALAETTPEMFATAIAPKVLGLQHLTKALQKRQYLERSLPDWVVACSALDLASGPALPWAMAPWAYQASNRWLDAWCVAQQRLWPQVQWQSLRWGPWQETGMAFRLKDRLPAALQGAYQRYLDLGLTNAEAGPRFAQALALGLPGLDLQALPLHSLERLWGTATAPHAAMATPSAEALPVAVLELAVLDLWRRYLGQAPTPSQRFSDLGGDSMAALQLKAAIEQELGLSVPLALLLQDLPFGAFVEALSPSDTLASKADRTEAAIPDVLVPLNEVPSGSRRAETLFFVHPISGTVFPFQHLAQALSRPLVGIQSVGLLHETATGQHTPHTDIEVMAQVYCQAIEAAGYPAPYAIGGWSFGALVAFAMARHWQQRGVAVSELILLDMVPPDPQQFRAEVLQAHFEADLARVWPEGAAQDAAQTLSPAQFAFKQRLEGIFQAHVQATQSFVPSPLSVPARVLMAQAGLAEASTTTSTDALSQAWQPYLVDCKVHEVPGDHYTCLAPESVSHWASHLAYTPSVSRLPDLLSTDLKEFSDHD